MGKLLTFTDLEAWKQGHGLALLVYKLTGTFPREEIFTLVSQMRRSAVSVTSNLAEGFNRESAKEKRHFYSFARGSVSELQSQLYIAKDVGYCPESDFIAAFDLSVAVHKMINGLIRASRLNSP